MFYSLKSALCYNKIIPEEHDENFATQNSIFDHQAYFIIASVLKDVINKVEIGIISPYQKGLSKIYKLQKVRWLGKVEGIPLKMDKRERCERERERERAALMPRIISKEKKQ